MKRRLFHYRKYNNKYRKKNDHLTGEMKNNLEIDFMGQYIRFRFKIARYEVEKYIIVRQKMLLLLVALCTLFFFATTSRRNQGMEIKIKK